MAKPMFSILVVALNAGEKLIQTVESIAKQTWTDYEVIVKDGGSKDGSVKALEQKLQKLEQAEFANRVRIVRMPDKSIYDAMNQATKAAQGEWLYFLNCGDYFYNENSLAKMAAGINEKGTIPGICYGDIFDRARNSLIASNPHINGFACYRYVPCHQACVYHRSLFAERGYRPEYRVRGDYEHFLWCYYKQDVRPVYVPVVLASYEGAGYSETAENKRRSDAEHKEITATYMSKGERFWCRFLLIITLAPLRTKISEHPGMAKGYNRLKGLLYGKKG